MKRFTTLALWIPLSAGGIAAEPKAAPEEPLQSRDGCVLLLGRSLDEKAADPSRASFAALLDSCLEAGGMKVRKWDKEGIDPNALQGVQALIFDSRSLELISRLTPESMKAIEARVKAGTGLVVIGSAAGALSTKAPLSRLLGGREGSPRPALPPPALALRIPDQSHPITQCVTDLVLRRCLPTADAGPSVTALARASKAPSGARVGSKETGESESTPAFWSREEGLGRVAVLALEAHLAKAGDTPELPTTKEEDAEPSLPRREARALAFLAARAVQWAATRAVTLEIPADMPLAAEAIGSMGGPKGQGPFSSAKPEDGFYRGRQIAPVMGFQGADWLVRPDREETELPEKMLDSLDIQKGDTVADLGAGVGYLTVRMARRVGPAGKVLASDVQVEMLEGLRVRLKKEGLTNVESVLATEADPKLPEGALDLVLMVDVYHELSRPEEVLSAVAKSLKPGGRSRRPGRLVLVEYRGEDPRVPIKPLHRTTVQQIRAELGPAGFRLAETKEFLPEQHILIFERR
jgi:ubiquinone/menaquinone biosynthesis C-methylase UbiE